MSLSYGRARRGSDLFSGAILLVGGLALVVSVTRRAFARPRPSRGRDNMVFVPGGALLPAAGTDTIAADAVLPAVGVRPFWLDAREVTVADFACFVLATGYVTSAERIGRSWVFDQQSQSWQLVAGADWQRPDGPRGAAVDPAAPVVQISWFDAAAFARWSGKRLPTDAEWEFAARLGCHGLESKKSNSDAGQEGGREDCKLAAPEPALALSTQLVPAGMVGVRTRTVLLKLAARVWEWCADWSTSAFAVVEPAGQAGARRLYTHRVLRGGSWLSVEHAAGKREFWTSESQLPHLAHNHAGFRCALSA